MSECTPLQEWFKTLEGMWTLRKRISGGHRFAGEAQFRQQGTGRYHLREQGELVLASGQRLAAAQSWVWHLDREGGLRVDYPEDRGGQNYHHSMLVPFRSGWTAMGKHLCGQDVYVARYRFCGENTRKQQLLVAHEIKGPAKDQRICAAYSRPNATLS